MGFCWGRFPSSVYSYRHPPLLSAFLVAEQRHQVSKFSSFSR